MCFYNFVLKEVRAHYDLLIKIKIIMPRQEQNRKLGAEQLNEIFNIIGLLPLFCRECCASSQASCSSTGSIGSAGDSHFCCYFHVSALEKCVHINLTCWFVTDVSFRKKN